MISRVSKTLYKENSLETLTNLTADSQKPYSDLSRTQKKNIHNSLQPFTKDFEQILKKGFQNSPSPLQKFRADSQKSCSELSITKKCV